jgi:hypothetical protein
VPLVWEHQQMREQQKPRDSPEIRSRAFDIP